MQFTTGTLTRCSGQNHYQIPVTVGAVTRTLRFELTEVTGDPITDLEEAERLVKQRLRSAYKESGAGNFAQAQTALNNKTFQV